MPSIFRNFVERMATRGYSENYIHMCKVRLTFFHDHLKEVEKLEGLAHPSSITPIIINTYQDRLLREWEDVRTAIWYCLPVKLFMKYCAGMGIADYNAFAIWKVRRKDREMVYVSLEEYKGVMKKIEQKEKKQWTDKGRVLILRDRVVVRLMYECCLRVGEVAALRTDQFAHNDDFIQVIGKGNKLRSFCVSNSLMRLIRRYIRERPVQGQYLIVAHSNHRACPEQRISTNALATAITKYRPKGSTITCHSFRHGGATRLAMGNVPVHAIKEILGHDNIATTQKYIHVTGMEKKGFQSILFDCYRTQ